MLHRIFNRTLLLVVAISCAGMLLLYLITGEEDVLFFFAGCAGVLIAVFLIRLLLAPLLGRFKDRNG